MSQKLRFFPIICLLLMFSNNALAQEMTIVNIDVEDVSCYGGDDGKITIEISGGQPPYTYTWIKFPFAFDQIISNETTVTFPGNFPVTAASYFIDINDAIGNNAGGNAIVNQPATAVSASITPDPAQTCSGSDLQLSGNADGGTPPYTHLWSGPGALHLDATNIENPVFNTPVGGDYEITYTLTDVNNCQVSQTITISNTENPATDAGVNDQTCGNQYILGATQSFGTGTWSASGPGSASFSNENDPNATVTVTTFGFWTFTWTETNGGCLDSDDVEITFFENPAFTTNLTNPSSPGASDGSIEINVTSGTSPYTYKLTDSANNETIAGPTPANSHTFSNLAEGIYNIEVTDGNNCQVNQNRELSDNPILSVSVSTTATCGGNNNGSIDIEILAGDSPFNVNLTTVPGGNVVFSVSGSNDFNYNISDLAAGDYNVLAEDNSGSIYDSNVTVSEGPSATISYDGSPYCGEGVALVTLTGFAGGSFSATPAGLVIDPATGTIDLTNSNNGTYTVTYSFDDGTCAGTAQTTVAIGELSTVTISYDDSPYCQETGGIAPVTINGQVVNASQNTYNAGNISSDYNFRTVSNSSSCPGTLSVNVPAGAVITSVDVQYQMTSVFPHYRSDQRSQLRCVSSGGQAEDLVYVGLGNSPGTSSYNRTGLSIANGVTGGGNIIFELHAGRTFNPNPVCSDQGVRVDNGTWTVTVHYTSGHEFSANDPGLIIDAVTGDIDLENSLPGDYIVTYTYNEGACEGTATALVTILPTPTPPLVEDMTACYTGEEHTISATPPSGATVVWYTDDTGTVITTAPSGTDIGVYTAWAASVLDGCESDLVPATLTIVESPEPPVPANVTVCFDGIEHTAGATVNVGDNLIWYANETGDELSSAPSATLPGIYSAWAAAEKDGCESPRVEVVLTINDSPVPPTAQDVTTCFDGNQHTAGATPPAGATIVWYTTESGTQTTTAPSATNAGTYTAWATAKDDITGCESTRVEVTLVIFPLPEATISYGAESFCPIGTVDVIIDTEDIISFGTFSVEPENGLNIDENTGSVDLSSSNPGTYEVEYRFVDENGCFNIALTTIIIDAIPDAPVAIDVDVCFDGTEHTASATPPAGATIVWYTTETGDVTTTAPTGINPGTYTAWAAAVGVDSGCESNRVLVTLTINDAPETPTPNNVAVCFDGTEHSASATSPAGATIVWYTTETGDVITTAPTATNPGIYTAWAAASDDLSGCESARVEITLTIFELPAAPIANDVEVCFDGTEHTASATPPADATIVWYTTETGDVTTTAPTATNPGTYTAWAAAVDNDSACESDRVLVTLTINDAPEAPVANNVEECFNGTAFSASATPPAGASIVWYTTEFGDQITTAPTATDPGTYTAWAAATDNITGCESTRVEVTLVIFPLPEATISYGAESFCPIGTVDVIIDTEDIISFGTFSVEPENGLVIDENTGTVDLASSNPGTYEVEYRFVDENGCFNNTFTTITIEEIPDAPAANDVEVCFDGTEHTASATPPAGATIVWYTTETGDVTTTAPTGTNPGTYTAWAAAVGVDSGCESDRVLVTLTINDTPDAPIANNVEECFNGTEFSASATPPAGASIVWYTTEFGDQITTAPTAINPGTYTAWAAATDDITGCESTRVEVTLVIFPLPEATISFGAESFCPIGTVDVIIDTEDIISFGTFSVEPENGLVIDENTGTVDLASSTPGTYEVEYRFVDENGCFNNTFTTITIEEIPDAPVANDVEVCFDSTEHTASATPPAGATIVWYTTETGDVTTTAPTGTNPGTYTAWAAAVGIDSGCESDRVLVTLTINNLPEAPTPNNVAVCFDGTVYSASATPPAGATIVWYTTETGDVITTAPTATNPGIYTAWAAASDDLSGCESARVEVTLTIFELPAAPIANDVEVCFDGTEHTASATPPAGASIVWYTTETGDITTIAPTATNPGTYTAWAAAVETDSGCESDRVLVTLTINDLPEAPTPNNMAVCFDGTEYSASATPPAGATIVWYTTETGDVITTAPTATNPGIYNAWAAASDDLSGCESARVEVTLTIFELPAAPIANDVEVCFDGTEHTASATPPAGATIVWYTTETGDVTATAPTATNPGTYTAWAAAVDNDTACESDRVLVTLTINDRPETPTPNNVAICFDGTEHSASATPPAGASIVWYTTEFGNQITTAPTATNPGTYTAWAAASDDITGCESDRVEVTLVIFPLPEATISYGAESFCPVGTVDVIIDTEDIIAFGTFSVEPQFGLSIDENSGTINLETSTPGTYEVEYRFVDENGCFNNTFTTITINEEPVLSSIIASDALCFGEPSGSITVEASAGELPYTFELLDQDQNLLETIIADTNDPQTFGNLMAGTYFVRVTDNNDCGTTISDAIIIDEPDPITIDPLSVEITQVSCNGEGDGQISLSANGGSGELEYVLLSGGTQVQGPQTGSALFTGLQPGSYVVSITDEAGCNVLSETYIITEPEAILLTASTNPDIICSGDEAIIEASASQGTAPFTFTLWLGGAEVDGPITGAESETVFFTGISVPGLYTVMVSDANGCGTTLDVTVSEPFVLAVFNVISSGDNAYCSGEEGVEIILDGSESGVSYQLLFEGTPTGAAIEGTGDALSFGLQTQQGNYTVFATHTDTGCDAFMAGSVDVIILPLPTVFNVTGGGEYCEGEAGAEVGLDNSETGVDYTLLLNGTDTGITVAGTDGAISFGLQTTTGTYTVVASNQITGCEQMMNGSAEVSTQALPQVYNVTGGGNYCQNGEGVEIGLDNSDTGVDYQLLLNGTDTGTFVEGTGNAISFGLITAPGTYTIQAIIQGSGCISLMNGEALVGLLSEPLIYNVTGGGSYCANEAGVEVALDGSETGIEYYLLLDGTQTGDIVSGTGNPVTFGLQTSPGFYTVLAINSDSGCESDMNGQAEIEVLPLPEAPTPNNVAVCFDGTEYSASATPPAGATIVWYTTETGDVITTAPTATNPGIYTAWAAASDDLSGCESARVEVTLTISELPALPIANDVEVCFDGTAHTASATPPAGATIVWYTTETGDITATAPTATNPGTYTAWAAAVDNDSACESDRILVTLTINDLPDAPVANNVEECFSGTEFSASATPPAGASIVWFTTEFGDQTTTAPTATDPGTYNAWAAATDNITGCESARVEVTLVIFPLPEATISYGAETFCPVGTVDVIIDTEDIIAFGTFSVEPETGLSIDVNSGTINLETSTTGTYIVEYRFVNENGCLNITTTTITIVEGPTLVNITPVDAICAGEASGSITVEASAGELPYTFELLDQDQNLLETISSDTNDPQTFGNLMAGTYFVRVTDNNDCGTTISDAIIIDEPDPITIDPLSVEITQVSCNGEGDGQISLTANGGSGELEYVLLSGGSQIQGPQTGSAFFTGLLPGSYVVSITDEAGCNVLSEIFNITEPEAILLTAFTNPDIICSGDEAIIEASASQGTAPFTFTLWLGGAEVDGPITGAESETVFFTGISVPGLYTVMVSDANGCETTLDVTVSDPFVLAVFNITPSGDNAYCSGEEGVEIILDGSESGVSYQLLFEGTPTGAAIEGTGNALSFGLQTQQGNYTVFATHTDTGCDAFMAGSVDVIILPLPTVFNVTGGGEYCEGEAGAEVGLDNSETGVDYTLLLNSTDAGITVAGTDGAISFGLQTTAGTYTVVASNQITGCEQMMNGSVDVTISPLPVAGIDASAIEVCEGATVTLTASGGDTYLWTADPEFDFEGSENEPQIEVTLTQTTTFFLTAFNDCGSDVAEVTITVVAAPEVDLGEDILACEGDIIILDAGEFDNVSYLWSDGSTEQTLEVSEDGTYWVEVTNLDTQCVSTDEVTVTFQALPLALVADDQSICQGEEVFIGVDDEFNPVPANTYFWTAEPEDPSLIDPTISNPLVSPAVTTTYTLVETYIESGCTNSNSVTITVIEIIADAGEDQSICEGESVTIGPEEIQDELIYSWTSSNPDEIFDNNIPNPTVSPEATTTYTLMVEHAELGCTNTDNIVITVNPLPLADAGLDQDICLGDMVMIGTEYTEPMPPNTYLWLSEPEDESISDPTISNPVVSPLETTTYTLIETYVITGCTNQNSIVVTVHDYPEANVIDDRDVCEDETINLGTGSDQEGLTYSWTSVPSGFFSNEANPSVMPGLYTLDSNNQITFILAVSNGFCTTEAQVVITVQPAPVVVIADDITFCSEDEAQNYPIGGDAIEGYSYSWTSDQDSSFSSDEANPLVSPVVTTTYTLVVTDTETGCFSTGQVTITINDLRIAEAGNPEICENETIAYLGDNIVVEGGLPPYQYFWTDNQGNTISAEANPAVEAPFASSYSLMVMDQLGCFVTATITIDFIESPEVAIHIGNMHAGDSYSIYPGQTVTFEAIPSEYTLYEFYSIEPETDNEEDDSSNEGEEKNSIENAVLLQSGAFNTYTTSELKNGQQIFVIAYDTNCPGISQFVTIMLNELPNAFTPDGDGINDIFGAGAELTIFNRWGQKVFEGREGWDGTYNGRKVSPGTYYYLFNVYDENNKKTTLKGSVTVVLQ